MNARHGRRRTPAQSGFTLVELTVSLLAGLLVAMGIVALSREATRTFHEEVRSSAAEAALRTAADRLRADLERAGFMSTGNIAPFNIAGAPRIARPRLATANVPMSAPSGLKALASLTLNPGGSVVINGLGLSGVQHVPLTPDILQISGNMTSADQFEIASYSANSQQGCTRIWLVSNSPAMYRVIGLPPSPTADADVHALFFPMGAPATVPFMVRVVDTSGCAQYLETCTATNGAGMDTTVGNIPYVDISANTPLVTAAVTGNTCGVTGFGEGSVLNPIQTVQWEITTQGANDPEPAAYTGLGVAPGDTTKYDLMRTFYDANGSPVPNSSEIIAEYAVDLSFAFSVDQGTALAPSIVTFPFDDSPHNDLYTVPPFLPNQGPERIRSVQARIVTRTAQADRSVDIPVPTNGTTNEKFAYRYCMQPSGCPTSNPTNALVFARTRTIVTEAALPNQAGNFYLMAPRSLSPAPLPAALLARAKRRAAARRSQGGAVLFIVAMIVAVLGSVGMYALAAASTEVRASGNERQSTQTHYLAQYGMIAAASYVQNDTTLYEQLATASPDWPCTSLPGVTQSADALLRACFRIEEADLTSGWNTPLIDYGGTASSTSGSSSGGSSGGSSGTSVPPLAQSMAPELGPTPMTAYFFVELTSPTQKAAPSRYALDLHFCFHEYTATAVGVTQPIYSQQTSNQWGAYSAQGQEMQRARFLLGPDRNCQ